MPLYRLMYVSRAAESLSYQELEKLLESARRHNGRQKVTGLLILKDGHFFQILEGEKKAVLETLGRIVQDERNSHMKVLSESDVAERIFSSWAMAFRDGDLQSCEGHEDLCRLIEDSLAGVAEERETERVLRGIASRLSS